MLKIKTEFLNNSSEFQKVEAKEEIKLEVAPQIILPNINQIVDEALGDAECVQEFKQEEITIEMKPEFILPNIYPLEQQLEKNKNEVREVKQEQEVKIEFEECLEIKQEDVNIGNEYNDPANKSYEGDDDETYSEKHDIYFNSQIETESSEERNSFPAAKRRNKHFSIIKPKFPFYDESEQEDDDEDQDETYSAKSGSRSGFRRKDLLEVRFFLY